jgi:hypothetical protein
MSEASPHRKARDCLMLLGFKSPTNQMTKGRDPECDAGEGRVASKQRCGRHDLSAPD